MHNRAASPLNSIPNALTAGENITLENRILETRPGYEIYASDQFPENSTVRFLKHVRFPTNEKFFLVAQISVGQWQGGAARKYHCVNYYDGKIYVWGGGSTVMDIYDVATRLWTTGTSGGTARTYCSGTVYNGKIYYWGGYAGGSLNTMDIYDIAGDSWSTGATGGTARYNHCAEYYNGKIYFLSGFTTVVDIYNISGNSWSTGTSGGPSDTNGMASCIVGDVIYTWGGQSEGYLNGMYSYDIGGDSWATLTGGGTARSFATMEHYSGDLYIFGGDYETGGTSYSCATMAVYSISGDSYSSGTAGPAARSYHGEAYDGSRYWYQHGGSATYNGTAYNYMAIYDMVTGTWSSSSDGLLYAALDDGSPAFEEIYDLGEDAGVISCDVLNDVAVITEGLDSPPLWWAGCLEDDGSDWTNPLAVWISQDGDNWFDVSGEVLDKDSDQYATLTGGVEARGALLIRSPVPRVKGFDITFQTVNTAIGVDSASDVAATFDSSGDVVRKDLKGDIVYWIQDVGVTGHFEGANITIDNAAAVDYNKSSERYGHGMALDSTDSDIYVVGGYDGSSYLNDVFRYDVADDLWQQPSLTGTCPTRKDATLVYNSALDRLEHFAGYDGSPQNDFYVLPLSTLTWSVLAPTNTPSARYGHVAVYNPTDGYSYYFGGNDGSTPYLNTMHQYDDNGGSGAGSFTAKLSGATAKEYATGALDDTNQKFYVFGGYGGSFLNELHTYNISLNTWSTLSPSGTPPTARNGACSCFDPVNSRLYVFGGYRNASPHEMNDLWYYDVSGNSWNEVTPTGGPPDARAHAKGLYYNGNFYVYGGHDGTDELNDLWMYDISENTWTEISYDLVGIPITGHGLTDGQVVEIYDTTNYDGTETLHSYSSTNEIVVEATYVAETFDGDEYVRLRPTLGAGNDAPLIEEGLTIYSSGGTASILTITGDGEQDAEVTLVSAVTTGTVTNIYGLYIDTDGLRPAPGFGDADETVSHNMSGSVTTGKISYRIVFDGADITTGGDQVRIKLQSGGASGEPGMEILNASIVTRSGSTANGTTTPTELVIATADKATLRQGAQTAYSAWADFTTTPGTDVIVTVDLDTDVTYNAATRDNRIAAGNWMFGLEDIYYYKANDDSYDDQNVTGYTSVVSLGPGVPTLDIRNRPNIPSTQFEAYTDGISINVGAYDAFLGIEIDADEPSGSAIYYAISFDGRSTFRVYLDSAWQTIVQYSDPNWQYYDGAAFQNATDNTLIGALKQAFADSDNQMTEAQMEALTSDELEGTGCYVNGVTSQIDFAVAMVTNATYAGIPVLRSITAVCEDAGTTKVKVWRSGAWADESWTDGTQSGDVPFAQDGQITTSSAYSEADYHVINGEPGYYFMLSFVNGLTPGTAITRIQMSAPCQPLSNIGLGWEETVLGFLYIDSSENSIKDFTTEVSDYTETDDSTAWLCDDITEASPVSPTTSDYVLIGNTNKFTQIQLSIHKVYNNSQTATMLAYYWDGSQYSSLTIEDNTESSTGETLTQKGTISFSIPDDWVQSMPFGEYSRGYWIKISWDSNIDVVGITECRLQPVPDDLAKHNFVTAWRNRVVMAGRPDASDQVDISRELEEYGWAGGDIHSQRVGGQDNIVALFSAFDRCFVVKPRDWFMLTESTSGFSFARLSSIQEAPVNNRCIVHAPAAPLGQPASPGLFFLGLNGAYCVTGIQSDLEWGTGQVRKISDRVNWWQSTPDVRIDLDYAYLSYGMYSSRHHCIFWAVPMITDGSTPQTTPNYLLCYDIGLDAWYPPWDLAFSALCSGFETNSNAPGKLGQPVLYAGDSSGRILKLFRVTTDGATLGSDNGSEIDAFAETGLLTPLGIEKQAQLEGIFIVAKTDSADKQLNMSVFLDGEATATIPIVFAKAGADAYDTYEAVNDFAGAQDSALGRFFKYRFDLSGPSKIFGIDIKHWSDIEDPDTG